MDGRVLMRKLELAVPSLLPPRSTVGVPARSLHRGPRLVWWPDRDPPGRLWFLPVLAPMASGQLSSTGKAVWWRWGCQPLLGHLGCMRWASAQAGRAIGGVRRQGVSCRPRARSRGSGPQAPLVLGFLLPEAPGRGAGPGRLGPKAEACRLVPCGAQPCSVLGGGREGHSPDMAVGLMRAGAFPGALRRCVSLSAKDHRLGAGAADSREGYPVQI